MSKVKDITSKCRKALKAVNNTHLYKELKAYDLEGCEIFYCVTHNGKLHLSGSSEYGLPPITVMLDAFDQLTNKDISNFDIMETENILYIIEKRSY